MATIQGIVAGISIDDSNKIEPQFDAMVYDYIIGRDGHSLSFSSSGSTLTVNGFAIADGVRGFFDNEIITIGANGYLYVKFTTYHDETVADTVELEWSATALTETHDNIGSIAGIYRMKVLTIVNSVATTNNGMISIQNTQNADEAETVTTTIAAGATGTTPATTDNSTKVATTAFVNNAINAKINEFATAQFSGANGVVLNASKNEIKKQGRTVICNFEGTNSGSGGSYGSVIMTIPVNFRPSADISIHNDDGFSYVWLYADGTVKATLDFSGGGNVIKFNAGYITP